MPSTDAVAPLPHPVIKTHTDITLANNNTTTFLFIYYSSVSLLQQIKKTPVT
jgi:hypothetical protein